MMIWSFALAAPGLGDPWPNFPGKPVGAQQGRSPVFVIEAIRSADW